MDRKINKTVSTSLVPICVSSSDIANAMTTRKMAQVFKKTRSAVSLARRASADIISHDKASENEDAVLTESANEKSATAVP